MAGDENCLVRLTDSCFYMGSNGRGGVTATDIPSCARHFSYEEADKVCQALLRRGHPTAVVTNAVGVPVTFAALRSATSKGNLPATLAELDRLPAAECRRRYRSDPAFRARVDEIGSVQQVSSR